jgi:hypothetical protein
LIFETMNTNPKTRADLAKMVPAGGLVIELGVAAWQFAEEMLRAAPWIRYLGVDRWSDHHDLREMLTAAERIRPYQTPEFLTSTFADAVGTIEDDSADMIYVDGYAHTGQEGGRTLRDWWPKVKPGGIFAGHDYSAHYPQTIAAVDAFVCEIGLDLRVIDENPHPSWWIIKPIS